MAYQNLKVFKDILGSGHQGMEGVVADSATGPWGFDNRNKH
jgi:hypothetical protein